MNVFSQLLKKILNKSSRFIISIIEKDINYVRKLYALNATVKYIENNMYEIPSVNSKERVHELAIDNIIIKDGLVLEFGVHTGYTINFISKKLNNYNVYGFDSFEGLPEFWRDGFTEGCFAVSKLPSVSENVTLVKGWFDETLPSFVEANTNKKISYLHIDCDLYSSTNTIFALLEHNIVKGTVIVFDEYFNYPSWEHGEFKAFKEFIDKTKKEYRYITYNSKHEQVAIIITKE